MQCCLEGMRAFLETFASLAIPEYRDLSFVQWAQLVQVLKLIPTLCFDTHDVPSWNPAQARKELRVGMILESLCYRMDELTSTNETQQNANSNPQAESSLSASTLQPDWFLMFKSVLKILIETYNRQCREVESNERVQRRGFSCPVLTGHIQDSEYWEAFRHCSIVGNGSMNSGLNDLVFENIVSQENLDNDASAWLNI